MINPNTPEHIQQSCHEKIESIKKQYEDEIYALKTELSEMYMEAEHMSKSGSDATNLYKHKKPEQVDITVTSYEIFQDKAYYHMWCVRHTDIRRFDSPLSYHFSTKTEAEIFKRLLEIAK